MTRSNRISVVGISVELPSGIHSTKNLNHSQFWEFLLEGKEAYDVIPQDRFNATGWKGNNLAEISVDRGSFLKEIDLFDNVEFGISTRDAKTMAPVTRKLIEHSFLALLDSGIDYRAKRVGCYMSGSLGDIMNVTDPDEYDARGSFANSPAMVANRVSNHLDLLGPSIPIDTACSSSLTALHLGVQGVLNGDCEEAVVGGCQLNQRFIDWITYSQGSLLAKDGKCKPFDAKADGFARCEGCVVVVVKREEDALKDNDNIYATILGTAINSTGAGAPPGAPVAEYQRDTMVVAFKRAGKSPSEVDYAELHATGTAKGDPTEANWVGEEFKRDDELLIGSTKGNIGHAEIAAFLASLTKVISMFEHHIIPPTANLHELNPNIHWKEYKLRVPVSPITLPSRSGGRHLIAMSGSGVGGSNGHVVVESPLYRSSAGPEDGSNDGSRVLLVVGGLSPRSALSLAASITEIVTSGETDWKVLSTLLGRRAKQFTWRTSAILDPNERRIQFPSPRFVPRVPNPIVFVFSGQGPQHINMGKQLFESFSAFRKTVIELDAIFKEWVGLSLVSDYGLFGDVAGTKPLPKPWPISTILPSIAVFQMALFDLFTSLGIKPDIVIGHSAGETVALYASGAAPKAMAMELAILRGQALRQLESLGGTMAAVSCSPETINEIIAEVRQAHPDETLELACFNTPTAVAISGHQASIDVAVELAVDRDIFARRIQTCVPMHSSMMETVREEFLEKLQSLFAKYGGSFTPTVRTYSTLTGGIFEGPFDAEYFWNNTRHPVQFTQAIAALGRDSNSSNFTFLEIAPHPVLASYITSMASESSTVISTTRRSKIGQPATEYEDLLKACGALTVAGHNSLRFEALNSTTCYAHRGVSSLLPEYPFVKKKFPLYPRTPGYWRQMDSRLGPLNHKYLRINKDTHPILAEHVIRGEPIMPAAGFIEMALEFGATALMNVRLRSILPLSSEEPLKVDITLDGCKWSVKSQSSSRPFSLEAQRLHADGLLSFENARPPTKLNLPEIRSRCPNHVGMDFYGALGYFSNYGTRFQRVTNICYGSDEALVSVMGTDRELSGDGAYILHPAILDAFLHVSGYRPFHGDFDPNSYYLPDTIEAVILHQRPSPHYFPSHLYGYVRFLKWDTFAMHYDIVIVDDDGSALCTLQNLKAAKHYINPPPSTTSPYEVINVPPPSPLPASLGKLYDPDTSFTFEYAIGCEGDLQWSFSGLNTSQKLDIWILATHGFEGSYALGMIRSLRREFLLWSIRLVIVPTSYVDRDKQAALESLGSNLGDELDILISSDGSILVPRMIALPGTPPVIPEPLPAITENCVAVEVASSIPLGSLYVITGSIKVPSGDGRYHEGMPVCGLCASLSSGIGVCDDSAISVIPPDLVGMSAASAAGYLIAALSMGAAVWGSPKRLQRRHVLIISSASDVSDAICKLYRTLNVPYTLLDGSATPLELCKLFERGRQTFTTVLSGRAEAEYVQLLTETFGTTGATVNSWNDLLLQSHSKDSCHVGLAFGEAIRNVSSIRMPNPLMNGDVRIGLPSPPADTARELSMRSTLFSPNKIYLIIGGIGSLGARLALFLYENGARHVVLTSRSGERSLQESRHTLARRMISYLLTFKDLDLSLRAVDALDAGATKAMVESLKLPLGGCILASAVLRDRPFQHLNEDDFELVRQSKIGALESLAGCVHMEHLEFIVGMASVSGLFGCGGQTSYSGANTLQEFALESWDNAFSFICPAISDSALMFAGFSDAESRFAHLKEWSVSSEDMVGWFGDAINRLRSGQRFTRYLPNLDWEAMDRTHGMTVVGKHVVPSSKEQDLGTSTESRTEKMGAIVRNVLGVSSVDFSPDVPFTSYGLDSLSASRLSFSLRPFGGVSQIQLLADMSLADVERVFSDSEHQGDTSNDQLSLLDQRDSHENVYSVLERYTQDIVSSDFDEEQGSSPYPAYPETSPVILLTDSHGTLAEEIISHLLRNSNVGEVYALEFADDTSCSERPSTISSTIRESERKLQIIQITGLERLTLALQTILPSVTHIVHSRWGPQNASSLGEYHNALMMTRILLDSVSSIDDHKRPKFLFLSSLEVTEFRPTTADSASESIYRRVKMKTKSPYTRSKWIGEMMVQRVFERSKLRSLIARLDDTRPTNSAWSSILRSAEYVSCLPDLGKGISVLPQPWAASAIRAVLNHEKLFERDGVSVVPNCPVIHIANPELLTWGTVVSQTIGPDSPALVPFEEWLSRLRWHRKHVLEAPNQTKSANQKLTAEWMDKLLSFVSEKGDRPALERTSQIGKLKNLNIPPSIWTVGVSELLQGLASA